MKVSQLTRFFVFVTKKLLILLFLRWFSNCRSLFPVFSKERLVFLCQIYAIGFCLTPFHVISLFWTYFRNEGKDDRITFSACNAASNRKKNVLTSSSPPPLCLVHSSVGRHRYVQLQVTICL